MAERKRVAELCCGHATCQRLVSEAIAEALAPWHAECDAVGIPYDPPGLVRHHRGNAGMAAAFDAMTGEQQRIEAAVRAALAERARILEAVGEVTAARIVRGAGPASLLASLRDGRGDE